MHLGGVMNTTLTEISQRVCQLSGKDISHYDQEFLMKILTMRWAQIGISNAFEYNLYMEKNPEEVFVFHNALINVFSQFFRDPLTFAVLDSVVLPRLLAEKSKGSELRIWSAGCSTGQEAYSLAMMLEDLRAQQGAGFTFRIIATDRSEDALVIAKEGIYESTSFQNMTLKHFNRYVVKEGDRYRVCDDLKRSVSFTVYDLLDPFTSTPPESIFGGFDVIFCCNVLIYYEPQTQQRIIKKLEKALNPNGFLVTGETEKDLIKRNKGFQIMTESVSIFRNNKRRIVE